MKKKLTLSKLQVVLVMLFIFALAVPSKTFARKIPVRFGTHEKLSNVYDLPNDSTYLTSTGKYFDLGIKYKVYEIIWIPVWVVEEPKLVGYESDEVFIELTDKEIKVIAAEVKIKTEDYLKIPFWDKWGGKILVIALLIIGIYIYFIKVPDSDDEDVKPVNV